MRINALHAPAGSKSAMFTSRVGTLKTRFEFFFFFVTISKSTNSALNVCTIARISTFHAPANCTDLYRHKVEQLIDTVRQILQKSELFSFIFRYDWNMSSSRSQNIIYLSEMFLMKTFCKHVFYFQDIVQRASNLITYVRTTAKDSNTVFINAYNT